MSTKEIFELLGIEVTTDNKKIKEAYSQKVKFVHPEENPEEFKKLYEAYKLAISYSKFSNQNDKIDFVDFEIENQDAKRNESLVDKGDGFNLNAIVTKKEEEYQEQSIGFFSKLDELEEKNCKESWSDSEIWKQIFNSQFFWDFKYDIRLVKKLNKYVIWNDFIDRVILIQIFNFYCFDSQNSRNLNFEVYRLYCYLEDYAKSDERFVRNNDVPEIIREIKKDDYIKFASYFEEKGYLQACQNLRNGEGNLYVIDCERYQYFVDDIMYYVGISLSTKEVKLLLSHYPQTYAYGMIKIKTADYRVRKYLFELKLCKDNGFYPVILKDSYLKRLNEIAKQETDYRKVGLKIMCFVFIIIYIILGIYQLANS